MTEINRPKLNLNALKGNITSNNKTTNQDKKTSINQNTRNLTMKKSETNEQIENTTIKKPSISINKAKPSINTTTLNKTPEIKKNIPKTEIENTNQTKIEKIENNKKNIEIKDENKEQVNENGEIFSGYTSDFAIKKEKALKEAKKFKLPDSPKKVFFAAFTSLLILSSLVLVIIFKVDNPTTNKLKTNVLELIGKEEKKSTKIEKKVTETWTTKTYTSLGFNIQYEISNTNKYKIEGKILNNKNEFDNYIKNKIDKLTKEKLKKHLQEEK